MKTVSDLMTPDPIVVELPGNRRDVMNLMVKHKLTGMPVIKDDKLKGFISRHDFFEQPYEDQLAILYNKEHPSIYEDDPLDVPAKLFVEKNIHYLPVKNRAERCVGILTTADMLLYVEDKKIKTPVGDAVKRPCVPLFEGTPIKVALQTMKLTKTYAFPVVDSNAQLIGIITDRDLFGLTEINGEIVISELGLGEDEEAWSWEGVRNIMKLYYEESKIDVPDLFVRDAMVSDPMSVFSKMETHKAARMMRRNDFGQLPIVDEMDVLQNMVYELDLISTLL